MTTPQTEPATVKEHAEAIHSNLFDLRYLVAMLASIFAICDDFDSVPTEHLTSMWPGLRIVVDKIENDLSTAIDAGLEMAQRMLSQQSSVCSRWSTAVCCATCTWHGAASAKPTRPRSWCWAAFPRIAIPRSGGGAWPATP